MTAEIIDIASFRCSRRPFAFAEACPACLSMKEPFIVAGRVSNRFFCDGLGSFTGMHDPVRWEKGENDTPVDLGHTIYDQHLLNMGYEIKSEIVRPIDDGCMIATSTCGPKT